MGLVKCVAGAELRNRINESLAVVLSMVVIMSLSCVLHVL